MAMARPAPRKRTGPQHRAPARHLRVIPGGKGAGTASGASTRAKPNAKKNKNTSISFIVAAAVTLAALVFGLVLLNVYLAQSSFVLSDLEKRVAAQEELYRNMRLRVATAESPDKIASSAAGLGLVAPDQQEYMIGRQGSLVAQVRRVAPEEDGLKAVLGEVSAKDGG